MLNCFVSATFVFFKLKAVISSKRNAVSSKKLLLLPLKYNIWDTAGNVLTLTRAFLRYSQEICMYSQTCALKLLYLRPLKSKEKRINSVKLPLVFSGEQFTHGSRGSQDSQNTSIQK